MEICDMTPNSNQEEIWWLDPVYWDERILNEDDVAGMAFDYPCIREIVHEAERRTWEEASRLIECLGPHGDRKDWREADWREYETIMTCLEAIDAKLKSLS